MEDTTNDPNAQSAGPQLEPVHFEFTHHTATTVGVAGTFNDWHAEAMRMSPLPGGRWVKETVLPPGTYEYCLVADGQSIADPLAKETVPNAFGGTNSLMKVVRSSEASHLADAEHLPLKRTNE